MFSNIAFCILRDLMLSSRVDEDGAAAVLVGGPNNVIEPLGEALVRGGDDDDDAVVIVVTT